MKIRMLISSFAAFCAAMIFVAMTLAPQDPAEMESAQTNTLRLDDTSLPPPASIDRVAWLAERRLCAVRADVREPLQLVEAGATDDGYLGLCFSCHALHNRKRPLVVGEVAKLSLIFAPELRQGPELAPRPHRRTGCWASSGRSLHHSG